MAYKTVLAVSSAGVAMSLFLCTVVGPVGAVVALVATGVLDGLNSPLWGALAQTFAGPQASGRWMGMQNSVAKPREGGRGGNRAAHDVAPRARQQADSAPAA